MKAITPGHKYELGNFEAKDAPGQTLQFIEKEPACNPTVPGELRTVFDGTTNEEVIKMLIDWMEFLYAKFPSEETACSISHLKQALYAQQSRTYSRLERGVEGRHLK